MENIDAFYASSSIANTGGVRVNIFPVKFLNEVYPSIFCSIKIILLHAVYDIMICYCCLDQPTVLNFFLHVLELQ